jgi:hypothetical protein
MEQPLSLYFQKNVSNKQSFLARNPAACRLRPTAMFGSKQWERKRRRYESTCLIGLDLIIEYNAFLFSSYIFNPMARQTKLNCYAPKPSTLFLRWLQNVRIPVCFNTVHFIILLHGYFNLCILCGACFRRWNFLWRAMCVFGFVFLNVCMCLRAGIV